MLFRTAIALVLSLSAASAKVSFNNDIRPLLSNTCFHCHGPDEENRKGELRLDTREGAIADHKGTRAVVPGDLDASELIYRITTDDADDAMPPPEAGTRFSPQQVAMFKQWIDEGAEYETHWSYRKPVRPEIPAVETARGRNEIDAFLLARLAREGLEPTPVAEASVLARRVALDLTGLPPTLEELARFVDDKDPDAYEKLVDQLLAKPAYGEHWARMWLDLARYADSAGYADDPPRTIWGYRDWVIRAFNSNLPFDQFTVEQLAGDLLEDPTVDQLVATGFHRNTQTNNEGGTNDEEYRNVAIVDRVNTTMETWMGTTMACAQCHTHKYDPITQEEYFKMFAILNQSQDADRRDESPTVPVFSDEQLQEQRETELRVAELAASLATPSAEQLAALARWENGLKAGGNQWSPVEITGMNESGAPLEQLDDGSLLASGEVAATETYTVAGLVPVQDINAVRLEVFSDARLGPENGPGRHQGNFVLSEFELVAGAESGSKLGRYVRIDLPGDAKIINIAEVQVFSGDENVALQGKATQDGQYADAAAGRAIDGNTDGDYNQGSVAHTAVDRDNPFWEVDLGAEREVSRIVVWNRTDGNIQDRLDGFKLSLLDAGRETIWAQTFEDAPERELDISLGGGQRAVFAGASSTYDQKDFPVSSAIDGDAGEKSGWAIGGQTGRDHEAVFELARPLPGGELQIALKQNYPGHAIGRFRISVSNTSGPHRALPHRIAEIVATPRAERSAEQADALVSYFAEIDPETAKMKAELAQLRDQLANPSPVTTVPILSELPEGKRRTTHIQLRGSYLAKGDEVSPGLPAAFHQPQAGERMDRLTLAKWLVDEDNPLTARVTANRLWEKLFGIGIVPTSEEFGSQGEPPTHPELLDWLAVELVESGWDVKALLKRMVMSEAYRRDSQLSDELAERDPDNRLLARGPRFRLSAEMVRDQALAVSGLLSPKMFGAPVRPPQPNLGISAAFGGGIDWKTSDGEDRFRRGLYTTWRRSNPYPSMAAFDAPSREVCTVRRDRTNTPLQALVTLNDPVYVEAAQSLARRMQAVAAAGGGAQAAIEHGFQLCLARPANSAESARLLDLFQSASAHYAENPQLAEAMATDPIGAAPDGVEHAELAALTIVGNVLLNLDEFLMKR